MRVETIGNAMLINADCRDWLEGYERLKAALQSIASNTCCDKCQEAALVARRALGLTLETKG
jgi:hypothetical protein